MPQHSLRWILQVRRFQSLGGDDRDTEAHQTQSPDSTVRNDGNRCTLPHEFVEIIEKHETGMQRLMKRGASAVKTYNHMLTLCRSNQKFTAKCVHVHSLHSNNEEIDNLLDS